MAITKFPKVCQKFPKRKLVPKSGFSPPSFAMKVTFWKHRLWSSFLLARAARRNPVVNLWTQRDFNWFGPALLNAAADFDWYCTPVFYVNALRDASWHAIIGIMIPHGAYHTKQKTNQEKYWEFLWIELNHVDLYPYFLNGLLWPAFPITISVAIYTIMCISVKVAHF